MPTTVDAPQTCRRGHEMIRRRDGRHRCPTCDKNPTSRNRANGRHPKEVLLKVSNRPLRERFVEMRARGECSASDLARSLGWMRPPTPSMRASHPGCETLPDSGRVLKVLGLQASSDHRGLNHRELVGYEMAASIGALLGMEPHEGGW